MRTARETQDVRKKTASTTRATWVRAGSLILRREGSRGLTLDRLCARMKKTKGAFYHHFEDLAALESAVFSAWKDAHTLGPIAAAEVRVHVAERRRALYRAVGKLDLRLELAIRAWAETDPRAQRAREDVDQTRVTYLASLWGAHAVDRGDVKRARTYAEIEYATFLGLLSQHGEDAAKHTGVMQTLLEALEATRP